MISEISLSTNLFILLCVCVTTRLCDKTTTINLCCPENQAYMKTEINGGRENLLACTTFVETEKEWKETILDMTSESEELNSTDFNIPSISHGLYNCPNSTIQLDPLDYLIPGITDRRITTDGSLQVDWMNNTLSFDREDICLAFTDLFNEETEEELKLSAAYFVCNDPNPTETGEEFSSVFYPLSVFISSIFVLFTIIIYIIIKDLRKNIFGKLTLGFLINVFIAYFTAGIVHSLNYFDPKQTYKRTYGCIVFGYIIQHAYVAILFWTNAMAFTLIKTFSNVLLHPVQTVESNKKLFLSIIYAQGMPLILTIITILMDLFGPEESYILPNMGKYRCMVGSEFVPNSSFLKTSIFLYFYLIILIITFVNIICFIITAFNFLSHWLSTQSMFRR